MKAYIGMEDWADEGNVFCYSVYEDKGLELLHELFKVLRSLELLPKEWEPYWGTNENFCFSIDEIEEFFKDVKDISEVVFEVLENLGVDGYDIFGMLEDHLTDIISPYNYHIHKSVFTKELTKADLEIIKPLYIGLFSEEAWNSIEPNE